MITHHDEPLPLETIELDDSITGGGFWSTAGKVLRKVPVVSAAFGAYDAYEGYSDWRSKGHGVGESLAKGGVEWLKDATLYDVWKPTPAY
jgi:hypothetical protein